jgi:hypothetical protein
LNDPVESVETAEIFGVPLAIARPRHADGKLWQSARCVPKIECPKLAQDFLRIAQSAALPFRKQLI